MADLVAQTFLSPFKIRWVVPLGEQGSLQEVNAPYVATVGPGPSSEQYGPQVQPFPGLLTCFLLQGKLMSSLIYTQGDVTLPDLPASPRLTKEIQQKT